VPDTAPAQLERADHHRVRPEHPHLPLVAMLVLTQLSVGAFAYLAAMHATRTAPAMATLLVAFLSLGASTLHLGRPIYAFRALRMWRRSWLSREVLLFSLFAGAAAVSVWVPGLTLAAALLGAAGVTASACIYLVPARPAWNTRSTLADFYLTALLLGPLFLENCGVPAPRLAICAAAAAQLLNHLLRFLRMTGSDEFELRASARLLANDLRGLFLLRLGLLIAGGMVLPLTSHLAAAFGVALAGELLSRYLFFVSVVPKNMAASFFRRPAA